jgi:hypothetical protein
MIGKGRKKALSVEALKRRMQAPAWTRSPAHTEGDLSMRAAVAEPRTGSAGSESAGPRRPDDTTHDSGSAPIGAGYQLWFHSLVDSASTLSFPCDAAGRVDMDALSDKARDDYLYARTVVGRVFRPPAVRAH